MTQGNVLITGAATRIGRAIALALGATGWGVVVHHNRSKSAADEVVAEIENTGSRALSLAADLSDPSQTADLMVQAVDAFGGIDCLINNAALFEGDSIETLDRESWAAHLNVNLTAPLMLTQAFARQVSGNAKGNVINIIDQRVWNPTPHFISYTLSKAGLWTMTQTLALALAPRIRVNGIGPGPTLPSTRQTDSEFEEQWQGLPLGRRTALKDIVDAVNYILGAGAMTGQMIALDGGQHLNWAPTRPNQVTKE